MSVRRRLLTAIGFVATALGAIILTEALDRRSLAHEVKHRWDNGRRKNVPFELLLQ